MQRKEFILGFILGIIFTILLTVSFLYTYNLLNKEDKVEKSSIAIMVYDENTNDYVKRETIPSGNFSINKEKTTCLSGGVVSNYESLGTVNYTFNTADECYIYIDLFKSAGDTLKSLYKVQGTDVGEGKLYLHDATLSGGANDGSYRYAGKNPNNYACFSGDDCTDDNNKYRIIGIFGDNLKLIKYSALDKKQWNSTIDNTWEDSTMEKYLNEAWLPDLGNKQNLIKLTTWSLSGIADADIKGSNNVKHTFDIEMSYSTSVERKVGLMYVSDYGYAADSSYWSTPLYNYNSSKDNNWLLDDTKTQWAITPQLVWNSNAYRIYNTGIVSVSGSQSVNGSEYFRPVFYLNDKVEIKTGSGEYNNPYIIDN